MNRNWITNDTRKLTERFVILNFRFNFLALIPATDAPRVTDNEPGIHGEGVSNAKSIVDGQRHGKVVNRTRPTKGEYVRG